MPTESEQSENKKTIATALDSEQAFFSAELQKGIDLYNKNAYSTAKTPLHRAYHFFKHNNPASFQLSQSACFLGAAHYQTQEYGLAMLKLRHVDKMHVTLWLQAQWTLANCYESLSKSSPHLIEDANITLENLLSSVKNAETAEEKSFLQDKNMMALVGQASLMLGKNYLIVGKYNACKAALETAQQYFSALNDKDHIAQTWLELGIAYEQEGSNTPAAIYEFSKAYQAPLVIPDRTLTSDCAQHLGMCFLHLEQYKTAKQYLEKALATYQAEQADEILSVRFGLMLCEYGLENNEAGNQHLNDLCEIYNHLPSQQKTIADIVINTWINHYSARSKKEIIAQLNDRFSMEHDISSNPVKQPYIGCQRTLSGYFFSAPGKLSKDEMQTNRGSDRRSSFAALNR